MGIYSHTNDNLLHFDLQREQQSTNVLDEQIAENLAASFSVQKKSQEDSAEQQHEAATTLLKKKAADEDAAAKEEM